MEAELSDTIAQGIKQGLLHIVGGLVHDSLVRRVTGLLRIVDDLKRESVPLIRHTQVVLIELSPLFCDADAQSLRSHGYSEQAVSMAREQAEAHEAHRLKSRDQYARDNPALDANALDVLYAHRPMRLVHIHDAPPPLRVALSTECGDVTVLGLEMPPLNTSLEHVEARMEAFAKALCEGARVSERSALYFDFALIDQRHLHAVLCVRQRQ